MIERHIKVFETHDDYEDFIMNGRVLMPNVSVCEDEYDCHFNDDGTIDRVHERPGQIDPNGHEYVDLGLPSGTLWATMNVGSTVVGEYGGYYEWGETEERDNYGAHKYYDNDSGTWNKYNDVDNKTELDLDDDVARVIMGGTWTLPTSAQCQELIDNCTFAYSTITITIGEEAVSMEITGVTVTSSINGNSIFLPYAGDKYGNSIENVGNYGYIWTKNGSYVDGDADAQCLRFGNSELVVRQVVNYEYGRTDGISARGVLTPGVTPGPEPTSGYRLHFSSPSISDIVLNSPSELSSVNFPNSTIVSKYWVGTLVPGNTPSEWEFVPGTAHRDDTYILLYYGPGDNFVHSSGDSYVNGEYIASFQEDLPSELIQVIADYLEENGVINVQVETSGGYTLEMYQSTNGDNCTTAMTACTLYTSYTFSTVDELIDFETNYTYGFGSLCYNTDTVPFTDTIVYYDWFTPYNSGDYSHTDGYWRVFSETSSIRKEFEQGDFPGNPTKAAAAINAVKDRLNTYGVIRCIYGCS